MNNKITVKMNVKDNLINVMRVNNVDYISLTDLARYKNPDNPGDVVINGWVIKVRLIFIHCGKSFLMKILN